jgi:serine/threonine protein kinase
MIGKTIAHYKITEELGRGGMGVVYKAEDTKLHRAVALKFLPPDVEENAERRGRFLIEARAAAALNHPNIATIHAIEEAEGRAFIVMEFIDGEVLKRRIDKGPMDLEEALSIAKSIAEGLKAAHGKGIIHRDIKSSNIMVTAENRVKIMDFGLAKLAGVSPFTKTGETTLGTIAYMSPEQIQGGEVDHRTDLWSFGVLLYQMITGHRPFTGDYEATLIYEILNSEPRAIQTFRPDVPEHIVSLVSGLLQKDPSQRIATAKEALERFKGKPPFAKKEEKEKSIAVLYFENMSSEKENEYFCAGMTEDLIIDLSKIEGLRVIARTDVLPFREQEVNSRQVGEALRVHYILEGSVRKAGNRMRITAQLVDVGSGFQVWAERYDRLIEDIFDVQIEVSEQIAEALELSLTDRERKSLAKKPTEDLRAYDFYMRGSELLSRRSQKERETAIQMFEHAIAIDPGFALVYVSLAEAYSYNYLFFGGDPIWVEKMKKMNEKALSLDPDLIEAQFGIGMVYFFEKQFDKAREEFERVLGVKGDFYPACFWMIWTSVLLDDPDSVVKYCKKAAELKPYSEEPWHFMEMSLKMKGDLKAAEKAGAKVVELATRKLEVNPNDLLALGRLAIAYANKGMKDRAIDAINSIMMIGPEDGISLYNGTIAYNVLGMQEKALDCLDASLERGTSNLLEWLDRDMYLDTLRDNPRFKEIIAKYGI